MAVVRRKGGGCLGGDEEKSGGNGDFYNISHLNLFLTPTPSPTPYSIFLLSIVFPRLNQLLMVPKYLTCRACISLTNSPFLLQFAQDVSTPCPRRPLGVPHYLVPTATS